MTPKTRLIGLTGTNGAGKGEAAAFFRERGWEYHSLSDVIRNELKRTGRDATRDNLIRMGNELRQRLGPEILARRVMAKVTGRAVIDSIRNPQEVKHLRRQRGFLLLALDAPVEVRYHRVSRRGRDESAQSLAEFRAKEQEEMSTDQRAQQLGACIRMADHVIINDGSIEDLHNKLEPFL